MVGGAVVGWRTLGAGLEKAGGLDLIQNPNVGQIYVKILNLDAISKFWDD